MSQDESPLDSRHRAAPQRPFTLWRLAGIALLVLATLSAADTIALIKHGILTTGTVVGINQEPGDDASLYSYWPVIEFRTTEGRIFTFAHRVGYRESPTHLLGKAVEVTYRKSDPAHAIWGSPGWTTSALLGLFGLLLSGLVGSLLRTFARGKVWLLRRGTRAPH